MSNEEGIIYEGVFICVYICRLFPLPEDFLTVKETVKENVSVDTDSGTHKLMLLLKY